MASRRQRQLVALVLAFALVLPAALVLSRSLEDSPADASRDVERARVQALCTEATRVVAGAVQEYVDLFAGLDGFEQEIPAAPDPAGLTEQFTQVRTDLVANDCLLDDARASLQAELAGIEADGPLATAVSAAVRSTAMRAFGTEIAPDGTVAPGDDLAAAVSATPPGGTVRLAAGEHRLDQTLYLLQDVTITGAGREQTRLVSTAGRAGVLVPRAATVGLSGLTVEHRGKRAASVLVVWAGRLHAEDLVLTGATVPADAARARPGDTTTGSGLTLAGRARARLEDSVVADNARSGVVAADRSRLSARDLELRDSGLCGLCALDTTRSTLTGVSASGNTAGVYLAGRARASIRSSLVSDNLEAGIAVQQRARATVTDSRALDNAGFGLGIEGDGSAELVDNVVRGSGRVGILLNGTAGAEVAGNDLADNGGADLVVNGSGVTTVRDNTCGSAVQVVLTGGVDPELSGNRCTVQRQAEP